MKWVESIFTPFIMGSSLKRISHHHIAGSEMSENATDPPESLSQCAMFIFSIKIFWCND